MFVRRVCVHLVRKLVIINETEYSFALNASANKRFIEPTNDKRINSVSKYMDIGQESDALMDTIGQHWRSSSIFQVYSHAMVSKSISSHQKPSNICCEVICILRVQCLYGYEFIRRNAFLKLLIRKSFEMLLTMK